ncbi:MAG TPA: biotin/lipoyl-containing protein, partial [Solirubrobacteraceae bacterium]|nr:biotin/lipoyl-containing protein [Solirubrobacteraceae bacterium]
MSSLSTENLVDVTMPQMGVSVAEGTVVAWRVEIGDRIEAEQTICEISTDKIDTEVPAPVTGIVAEILVDVDTTVDVGVVLARIATGDGAASAGEPPSVAPAAEAPARAEPPSAAAAPVPAPAEPAPRAAEPAAAEPGPNLPA